jgi:hypothetical protein
VAVSPAIDSHWPGFRAKHGYRDREYVQASYISLVVAVLGWMDEAFEWPETAPRERDAGLIFDHEPGHLVNTPPILQEDPRVAQLWKKMGLRGQPIEQLVQSVRAARSHAEELIARLDTA